MAQLILTLNPGSSSLKFALFQAAAQELDLRASGIVESIEATTVDSALNNPLIAKALEEKRIRAIGCRVVHGGEKLTGPTIITHEVLEEIRSLCSLAPLHNPLAVNVIENCIRRVPKVPIVAVFDTAFHHSLPPVAATYAIPDFLSSGGKIRRYGFHGIAHQQVSTKLLSLISTKVTPSKVITCHLGNGASICALQDGRSVDTSMGFTPMEGLVMGTRSGDIDPGLVLHLLQGLKLSVDDISTVLNKKSGLLALSKLSSDVRTLEQEVSKGNAAAEFALDCFAYRAAKYIGGFMAALGGLEAIAFSGGIGEHSTSMRERICRRLTCFGLEVDQTLNASASGKAEGRISSSKSRISAWVIHADEELQIARETDTILKNRSELR